MSDALLPFGLAFLASLLIERVAARPGSPGPALAALPARLILLGALYVFWLGVWARPWLAGFACAVTLAVMTAISVRKRQLVGEPLGFSDFGLLRMVVRHPDLYYMGFMARPPFIGGATAFLAALGMWLWLEPAYRVLSAPASLLAVVAVLALSQLVWRAAASPIGADPLRRRVPAPDPERHLARWGLLLTLVLYALRWRREIDTPWAPADVAIRTGPNGGPGLRRVILVQFESFLDPVRFGLSELALPGLERARAVALQHGPLLVPAHGAFTMRSEHAVLSGLSEEALGFRRFDPYLSARGPAPATIASRLRGRGYRTTFIHPFRAGFFGRDRIVPRLGFDRLVFEDDFAGAERLGPYVSDRAMVARILDEASGPEPVLVAAVTMENHGPWGADRFADEPDPTRQYLRHIASADAAIELLLHGLAGLEGPSLLCVYGDHPPILPGIVPSAAPQTDYAVILVGAGPAATTPARPITADALGRLMMELAGVGEAPSAAAERAAFTPSA